MTVGLPTLDPSAFTDPLAAALWRARTRREALPRDDWPDLDMGRAAAVAAELYAGLDAGGVPRVGAKGAATDAATQAVFGATEPLIAPIFGNVLVDDGATVRRTDFTAPHVEAEIGMRVTSSGVVLVPCIEIADSRFSGGTATIAYIAADFATQGGMIFGEPASQPTGAVQVRVAVDGEPVNEASRDVDDAREIYERARAALELRPGDHVATGSFFPPMPMVVGEWVVDFGDFGRVSVTVR
jgi:2-keto-4-pentenoate hydratase